MTNTEMWLDETISHIKSIKSDIWMLHEIMSLPNCNDCKNKDCEYKPKWGEHIRYNCPLHSDRKTEPQLEVKGSKRLLKGKDEPQTEEWTKEKHEAFYTFLWNAINPNEMEEHIAMFESKGEPQTERSE